MLCIPAGAVPSPHFFHSHSPKAAAGADQQERWVAAPSSLERQLPTVKLFDASSAVDADAAIQSTLQTAFRAHLESDEFSGDIRAI